MLSSARTNDLARQCLGILADDLTGACDAAAAFAGRGAPAVVSLRAGASSNASVQAVCTASRDCSPESAAQAIRDAASSLASYPHLFKKIDSVFRGNTFAEIAAATHVFPERLAVIAPAFPANGRTCIDSTLHHSDLSGTRTLPLRKSLHAAGLQPVWLPASSSPEPLHTAMRNALMAGVPAVFCHAICDADLDATVLAAQALRYPLLWIGSAGLAHALARRMYATASASVALPSGPVVFLTGSTHPVTLQQLAGLEGLPGAHVVPVHRGLTTFAEVCSSVAPFPPAGVGCLVMNGGDTALHVCHALGIHALRVLGEFAPGIPVAHACGGPWEGTTVLLKSGGFGEANLFHHVVNLCAKDMPA